MVCKRYNIQPGLIKETWKEILDNCPANIVGLPHD